MNGGEDALGGYTGTITYGRTKNKQNQGSIRAKSADADQGGNCRGRRTGRKMGESFSVQDEERVDKESGTFQARRGGIKKKSGKAFLKTRR